MTAALYNQSADTACTHLTAEVITQRDYARRDHLVCLSSVALSLFMHSSYRCLLVSLFCGAYFKRINKLKIFCGSHFAIPLSALRSEDPKLIIYVITFELVQPICSRYINVTDRQTDGQTNDIR